MRKLFSELFYLLLIISIGVSNGRAGTDSESISENKKQIRQTGNPKFVKNQVSSGKEVKIPTRKNDSSNDSSIHFKPTLEQIKSLMILHFGKQNCGDPIEIYVVPSCPHCAEFLGNLQPFLKKYGAVQGLTLRFLISSPTDIRILKLFAIRYSNPYLAACAKSTQNIGLSAFWDYLDFMKVFSNNEPNLLKVAKVFGFFQDQIDSSELSIDGEFEHFVLAVNKENGNKLEAVIKKTDFGVPILIYNFNEIKNPEDFLINFQLQ